MKKKKDVVSKPIVRIGKPRNKADRCFANFQKVLYKVTGDFGQSELGEIREARLINAEGEFGLLYHSSDRHGCGSFELCVKDGKYWEAKDKHSWINYATFGKK